MKFIPFNPIWPTKQFFAPIQIKGNNTATIFVIIFNHKIQHDQVTMEFYQLTIQGFLLHQKSIQIKKI